MTLDRLILSEIGTNCYILTDDTGEGAVIDPGGFNDALVSAVKNQMKTLKYILLTHGHFDHILGVYDLKELTGATVAIHEQDADCLLDDKLSMACSGREKQKYLKADLLLKGGETLFFGNTELEVLHTPGHTKGGVCYIDKKDKIIFSGDTLFHSTAGRTDFRGGSIMELLVSLKKLSEYPDDYEVMPGHNISTVLGREKVKNRFMRKL